LLLTASTFTAKLNAQSTPFLSDDQIRMLTNEISGDRSFEHIRWLSHWHRNSGMEGYFKAADYVLQAAKDAGLEDVKFIEQPLGRPSYTAKSAELWMMEPVEVKLADIGDHALYLADGSHDADVSAELVWLNDGSEDALENIDVEGKIVLTSSSPGRAVFNAVYDKGAVGVVAYPTSEGKSAMDFPDQIPWSRIPMNPPEGKSGTFAFVLPPRKGDNLRRILASDAMQDVFATGQRTKGGRVVLKARVDTEISETLGRTGFIEGWIRGTKYHDQQIVLTAHLQEEQGSANDDGSGCGNLLELARVFTKFIDEGKMQRPLRDIRFWWTDEIYSEYRYFRDFPDEPKKLLVNLHQDMVGAKQSMGSRVQHLIYPPQSITSYLDALFESIGTYVIQTNNAFLSASRSGAGVRPHTRAIYSTRGTREGFAARFVPYFGASDYMCFIEGAIGVPAIGLINWDDFYIHSSDDDLHQIDQTQLARNAFIIGAMAQYLGFAEAGDVPLLASETFAQGSKRLSRDLQVGMQILTASKKTPADGWKDVHLVVEQGIEREKRAMQSIHVFANGDTKKQQIVNNFVQRIKTNRKDMLADLKNFYNDLHGSNPKSIKLSNAESAAAKKIPENAATLETYFSNRGSVRFSSGLHSIMRAEVYNFVNGKRSYYDIYKAVRAEAVHAGEWYYGTVKLEDVVGLLDAAVDAGALVLK
ncbi:MAG: M28 family peptidase, partial [bacterium]